MPVHTGRYCEDAAQLQERWHQLCAAQLQRRCDPLDRPHPLRPPERLSPAPQPPACCPLPITTTLYSLAQAAHAAVAASQATAESKKRRSTLPTAPRTLEPCHRRPTSLQLPPGPPALRETATWSCRRSAPAGGGRSLRHHRRCRRGTDTEWCAMCGRCRREEQRGAARQSVNGQCLTHSGAALRWATDLFPGPAWPASRGTAPPGGP